MDEEVSELVRLREVLVNGYLFSNGEKVSTSADDIVVVDTLISRLQEANLEDPHAFVDKYSAYTKTWP